MIDNKEDKKKETWTVLIYGPSYWGCGNTHAEAVKNAKENGFRKTDHHVLVLFSEPVKNVSGSAFGIRWEWADKEGIALEVAINEKSGS